MQIRCKYCRGYMEDTDEVCPHCGGVNEDYKRNSYGVPETIEELQKWYTDHNLPPEEVTRFFIGKNHEGPKAFGIYKNEATGECIVYKNKSDGTRAIRYKGKDEAYAVNEIYMKLKEEILHQKENNSNKSKRIRNQVDVFSSPKRLILSTLLGIFITFGFFFLVVAGVMFVESFYPSSGYYTYNDGYYYYLDDSWYMYDDYYGWEETVPPTELTDNFNDYYDSSSYYSSYGVDDFRDTSYYEDYEERQESSDSDWDSSSSWDSSDSWDSSSSDWDSDW